MKPKQRSPITVFINGQPYPTQSHRLSEVLAQHAQGCFAVAVNQQFIAQEDYVNVTLADRDHIEIVIPMQGG